MIKSALDAVVVLVAVLGGIAGLTITLITFIKERSLGRTKVAELMKDDMKIREDFEKLSKENKEEIDKLWREYKDFFSKVMKYVFKINSD